MSTSSSFPSFFVFHLRCRFENSSQDSLNFDTEAPRRHKLRENGDTNFYI